MHLSRYVESLTTDLAAAGELGDESLADAARRLAVSLRSSLAVRLIEALGEATMELNAQIPGGRIEVRLVGQDPELVFVAEEEEVPPPAGDEASTARISLRLPEALKASVEAAAAREGVSTNTWIVRALSRGVSSPVQRSSNRITGFARS